VAGLAAEAGFELRALQQSERPGAIPAFFHLAPLAGRGRREAPGEGHLDKLGLDETLPI